MELGPNGAAHLIPVAILVDGEFYDAGAYKAAPIPMALESGTVYEAERTGTSLGLFTVTGALEGPDNTWSGAGRFVPAGSKPPANAHKADSKPRDLEDTDSRPVLRRRAEKPTPAEAAPPAPSASAPPASASPAPASPAPSAPTPSAPATATPAPSAATPPSPPADATTAAPTVTAEAAASDENDPDRPTLKRGKPTAASKKVTPSATTAPAKTPSKTSPSATPPAKSAANGVQLVPAISDAAGPEPHSYAYPMKADDELQFRKKILAMAVTEIGDHVKQAASATVTPPAPTRSGPRKTGAAAKAAQPTFDDVQLRVIDPSSSNEPILILMAKAQMPHTAGKPATALQYMITLVARQDIYGDLHKVFSNITDAQHLDVLPRYDFIDVVDADGDGRGELLFRKVSDSASAFTIYRVIGNQLWPLFDGPLGG